VTRKGGKAPVSRRTGAFFPGRPGDPVAPAGRRL
jgi:hypothetical protein